MADRTIRITGRGNVSVTPDTVRLLITQSETFSDYTKAVEESAKKKSLLTEAVEELGFHKSDLKTVSFDITDVHENYQDKQGRWKQKFVGYEYSHRMKLEFARDNERLGKVLYELANCKGKPQLELCFTVSDAEKVKNELIGKAVEDARIKAEVLTKAAGVALGEIQMIDYSWGEIQLVTPNIGSAYCKSAMYDGPGSYDMDMEPDDISASETVTVVWEIQ